MTRSLEELVDRQFKRWEASRRSRATEPHKPCIALSRLPGAGAAELGRKLAERLGYAFFGIELVDHIARETGHQRELVAGVDEHVRNAIDRFVADARRSHGDFTESEYQRALVRTVATLGERGGAVILGRGAQFILPAERALRALIVAPEALRAENLAKRHGLTPAEAREQLAREDAERRDFLQHHFGRDPDDAEHYDVGVNLGTLSMDAALELVERALRMRFPAAR